MDVDEFLKANNINQDIIDTFSANMIFSIDDLKLLSESDLLSLVPLVGPRNRIKDALSKLHGSGDISQSNGGITLTPQQEVALKEIVAEATTEDVHEDNENGDKDSEKDSNSSESDSAESSSEASIASSRKRKSANRNGPKRKSHKASDASGSYDLEELLVAAGGPGELILSVYQNTGELTDSNRSSLAKLIINHETAGDFGKRVTKERAAFLAKKGIGLFKNELMSTWYREEARASGNGKMAKGRIIRRYYNQRRSFESLGVLTSTSDTEDESDMDADLDTSDAEEGTSATLAWLANKNVTPWPRVLSAWKETSKKRMKDLQKPVEEEPAPAEASKQGKGKTQRKKKKKSSDAKVASYSETYPQIQEPQGWTLLEIDFESIQRNALLKMDLNYVKLEKFVLHKLRTMNKDYKFDEFDAKPQSERSLFIFLSLSQLFPVTTVASFNKASWRPSRQEMKDSFLLKAKTYGDLKTILEARQTRLTKFQLTCQPLPVVIKEQSKYKCFVKYDNFEYCNLESPMKAVDVAFKSYHALHAYYPPESESMWLFLQKAVYEFSTPWDKKCEAVDRIVAEFLRFKV